MLAVGNGGRGYGVISNRQPYAVPNLLFPVNSYVQLHIVAISH